MTTITSQNLVDLFLAIAAAIDQDKERLSELDGVIGDADHGVTMNIGFTAVKNALGGLDTTEADPTTVFNTSAKSFLNAVGASSGPLYATAFMRAGAAVKGESALDRNAMVEAFKAMAKGIQDRGKAERGDKTMVDAWLPASEAIEAAAERDESLAACFAAAATAAEEGAEATKTMQASKGRASWLGARSLGHMDPGAASTALIVRTMADVFAHI
ncbi:dihydroxyacetone kinase subunit L [Jiella sp. MQZ9-1]|uniref:Dihydroxyacetone kinase subunit L n=1 Tax=Jiella flava TaxID=2816857 RepID=A0A939JSI2_9HYPH|nr:dihydroxyacetone kinase subunit DhaL [Jiella flava]MBO0662988.1 dihydroxyacetone kinase subunit L [Jiella flava]MCD2471252.1 dihydroxyacetone kinase subunit L [Jiella flava]